jgi:CobQ/CobB/MinD/ParA nucleotide binding domain
LNGACPLTKIPLQLTSNGIPKLLQIEDFDMHPQDEAAWACFVVAAGRGGVGKTTISMLLAAILLLEGRTPTILEADLQNRLNLLFPDLVTTVDIDQLDALADDPLALARAFSSIPRAVRTAAVTRTDVIVDSAATWHEPIIKYCARIDLGEKVAALGGKLVFLLPVTADTDSIILAIGAGRKIESLLPRAELIFVINEYPHTVAFDTPAVNSVYGTDEINRLLTHHRQVRLRSISQKIWGNFERANMSVLDVSDANPTDLMKIADADVDTTEIMQGIVQGWLNSFTAEMQPVLQFANG